jgi:DNA-binding PadR family transcriptional regulator
MAMNETLGEFELSTLASILQLGTEAYGMKIRQIMQDQRGKRVSFGAIYTTLDRLREKGFVTSWLAEPTRERGGRAKQYFEITAAGREAFASSQRTLVALVERLKTVPA